MLHGKDDVFGYFHELAEQSIVLCAAGDYRGAVGRIAPLELAGDVRHHRGYQRQQPASLKGEHPVGLTGEVGRVGHHAGHEPAGVLERHEATGSGLVARKLLDPSMFPLNA